MSFSPSLRFLYLYASDLDKMRAFYSEVIGLKEIFFQAGSKGGIGYQCDALQFTILPAPECLPDSSDNWAEQPGWQGGTQKSISWSIETDKTGLNTIVQRVLGDAQIVRRYALPQWVGYWSFPVKDPMGNTVEITFPEESPEQLTWV